MITAAKSASTDEPRHPAVSAMARIGYGARGLIYLLVGVLAGCFLTAAAIHGNPRDAHELGGALSALRSMAYGQALVGLFAVAFIGSGIADTAAALFRRFEPDGPS